MPLQATSGAASYDAFGGGVPVVPNYIEEVFSAFVYAGSDSAQTLTDNIDRTKGALDWFKVRSATGENHILWDTVRSGGLETNTTSSQATVGRDRNTYITQNNGNVVLNFGGNTVFNRTAYNYVKWTFRKQQKFFDVVTYTGNGTANNTISHSLGSVPGFVIVKNTGANGNIWAAWHRSITTSQFLYFSGTNAVDSASGVWGTSGFTSSSFSVGTANSEWNANGQSYIAYLFAHNAGGFGLTGTDNVISCGSYTGNGSATGPVVTLGYEPQWLMIKNSTGSGNWQMIDNMRGMPVGSADATLQANLSNAESSVDYVSPTATGFQVTSTSTEVNTNASTYIYIAIRRGPMKVPTSGTSVFNPNGTTISGSATKITTSFPVDLTFSKSASVWYWVDRLRGNGLHLRSNATNAESAASGFEVNFTDGYRVDPLDGGNIKGSYALRRAPGFFDEVGYTGNDTAGRTVTHNLGVVPELMIVKTRSAADSWYVYSAALGNTKYLVLNTTAAQDTYGLWNNTSPTSSVFTLGVFNEVNGSTRRYVAYLFATCAGVSKVGSYTGNGSSQTINCGFTGGARFVMIKRTNASGDWYVWDTARGIVSDNDPRLSLNSTAAEVTTDDSVDTDSTGFVVNQLAATNVNVNAATYIFLAIA